MLIRVYYLVHSTSDYSFEEIAFVISTFFYSVLAGPISEFRRVLSDPLSQSKRDIEIQDRKSSLVSSDSVTVDFILLNKDNNIIHFIIPFIPLIIIT